MPLYWPWFVLTKEHMADRPGASSQRIRESAPNPSQYVRSPGASAASDPPPGRRERRRLETVERLVSVTRNVLFERDLRGVSVAEICDAADLGKGTFFNYFATKEQVVPRVLVFTQRELAEALGRVQRREISVEQTITDWLRGYVCPSHGDWLTYEQNLMQSLLREDVRREFSGQMHRHVDYYIALMALGQQDGSVRRDESAPNLGVWVYTYIIGFTIMLWMRGTSPTPAMVDAAIGTLHRALRPVSEPPPLTPSAVRPSRKRPASPPRPKRGRERP